MLGHSLLVPEDEAELPVDGVLPDEDVPLLLLVAAVAVVPVEFELVLEVLVAALAASAPPAMSPVDNAPVASTVRRRSFISLFLLS
jgi:hypothetical protein